MSSTTTKGRHAAEWTPWLAELDKMIAKDGQPSTGQHRANLIHAFRKHLKARFGK